MNTVTHRFALMDESRPGRTVTNMRLLPAGDSGALVSVHPKVSWGGPMSQPPLLRMGQNWLCGAGTSLSRCDAAGGASATLTAAAPGDIAAALAAGADSALVMCARGALAVECRSGLWSVEAASRRFPAVRFRTANLGVRTFAVGARSIAPAGTALSESARKAVTADLAQAYEALSAEIAADGLHCAPVVARCRYFDARGRLLFTSPPVLVCPPMPFEPAIETAFAADGASVGAYTLELPLFRIEAAFEAADCPEVRRVEVALSPALHPFRADGAARVVMLRNPAGTLRVSLPGYGCAVGAEGGPRLVERVIERLDSLETTAACVAAPFTAAGTVATVPAPNRAASAAGAAVDAALRRRVVPAAYHSVMLAAPHSFGAAVACAGGAPLMAWGRLTAVRFEGFSPEFFVQAPQSGEPAGGVDAGWSAEATVRMADGSAVQFSGQLPGPVPASFGPVLCYPAPDAVELTLVVRAGGIVRRGVFALHPDASGCRALYVAPGATPVGLPVVQQAVAAVPAPSVVPFPDAVAFCDAAAPLAVVATARLGGAPVAALAPLRSADGAWEYGRHRFVAASADGIFSLALDGGSRAPSVKQLGTAPVASAAALAAVGDAVYAATPSGLLRIAAGRRRLARLLPGSFASLAFDPARRELLAIGPDICAAFCLDHGGWYLRPEYAGTEARHAGADHFLATGAGGPYLTMDEDPDAAVDVAVDDLLCPGPVQPRAFTLEASGSVAPAAVTLYAAPPAGTAFAHTGSWGSGLVPLRSISLAGTVLRPVAAPVLARPCATLRLHIAATTSGLTLARAAIVGAA